MFIETAEVLDHVNESGPGFRRAFMCMYTSAENIITLIEDANNYIKSHKSYGTWSPCHLTKSSSKYKLSIIPDETASVIDVANANKMMDTVLAVNTLAISTLRTNIVPFGLQFWTKEIVLSKVVRTNCDDDDVMASIKSGSDPKNNVYKLIRSVIVDGRTCTKCGGHYLKSEMCVHSRSSTCKTAEALIGVRNANFDHVIDDLYAMDMIRGCPNIPSELVPTAFKLAVPEWVGNAVNQYYESPLKESMTLYEYLNKIQQT